MAVVLGVAVLVTCQNGVPVKAATILAEEAQLQKGLDNTKDNTETIAPEDGNTYEEKTEVKEEKETEETESLANGDSIKNSEEKESVIATSEEVVLPNSDSAGSEKKQLIKITDLHWSETGEAVFQNPNEESYFVLPIYKEINGEYKQVDVWEEFGYPWSKGEVICDLYHFIMYSGPGNYKFKVQAVHNDFWESEISEFSTEFHYEKPEVQLPVPLVNVNQEGLVTCALPAGSDYQLGQDYGFSYELYQLENGNYKRIRQQGTNETSYDLGRYMKPGGIYCVRVQTLTRNCLKWNDSEWSEYIPVNSDAINVDNASHGSSSSNKSEDSETAQAAEWKPTTPDEMKRYAVYSKEKAEYTVDTQNAYTIVIQNAMQGKKCFDSFEAALDGYTIGRTYNILPSGKAVYKMSSKARITLTIPKELQKENRKFRMVCVTAEGVPVILNDLDSDPATITFETDTYYAYALVYKDVAAKK